MFAAYGESGQRFAKGGRYDDVGEVFGRSRAATGFDIDLKTLAAAVAPVSNAGKRVHAPVAKDADEAGRWALVTRLREEGYVVIEQIEPDEHCDFSIVNDAGQWKLVPSAGR